MLKNVQAPQKPLARGTALSYTRGMNDNLNEWLINLEMKVAYQDDKLEKMNEVLFDQQKVIDELTKKFEGVLKRVKEITPGDANVGTEHENPPHY